MSDLEDITEKNNKGPKSIYFKGKTLKENEVEYQTATGSIHKIPIALNQRFKTLIVVGHNKCGKSYIANQLVGI